MTIFSHQFSLRVKAIDTRYESVGYKMKRNFLENFKFCIWDWTEKKKKNIFFYFTLAAAASCVQFLELTHYFISQLSN